MEIQNKGNSVIIKDSNTDLEQLLLQLTADYQNYKKKNIILDITSYKNLAPKDLTIFLPFAKTHKKNKQSFVIVISDIDFNKVSDKINIVPTLQEAEDIIEMEEIERDLGF
jgi:hypothetical protein